MMLADTPHPYGLSGFAFWLAVAALLAYTALIGAGGFLIGRLARDSRRTQRQFDAESLRYGRIAGAERNTTIHADQPAPPDVPDLGTVLSHRPGGHRR